MPFYYGKDEDVIGGYGNSFVFRTYIAQVRERLLNTNCDDFRIIGDDVLLNPSINEYNVHERRSIPPPGAFYEGNTGGRRQGSIDKPADVFPEEHMYLHPVKLSKFH